MNLKKKLLSFALTALAASSFVGPASAAATTQMYSSNAVGACTPNGSGTPRYNWDGLYNDSTTENMWLDCSLPAQTASVAALSEDGALGIFGKNRSVSEDLTCGFKVVTGTGFVVYETADHKAFNRTVPANTPNGMLMTLSVSGMGFTSPIYASCKIPKKQGASGYSGLTGLFFSSTVYPE